MKIDFRPEELLDIFSSLDFDGSGRLEWAELQADFQNVTSKTSAQLWEEEKQSRAAQNDIDDEAMQGFGISYTQKGGYGGAGGMSDIMKADMERRISSLESKLKVAYMEIKKEQQLKDITNQSLVFLQKHHDDLLKQFTHAKDEIFNHEKLIKQLRD